MSRWPLGINGAEHKNMHTVATSSHGGCTRICSIHISAPINGALPRLRLRYAWKMVADALAVPLLARKPQFSTE